MQMRSVKTGGHKSVEGRGWGTNWANCKLDIHSLKEAHKMWGTYAERERERGTEKLIWRLRATHINRRIRIKVSWHCQPLRGPETEWQLPPFSLFLVLALSVSLPLRLSLYAWLFKSPKMQYQTFSLWQPTIRQYPFDWHAHSLNTLNACSQIDFNYAGRMRVKGCLKAAKGRCSGIGLISNWHWFQPGQDIRNVDVS